MFCPDVAVNGSQPWVTVPGILHLKRQGEDDRFLRMCATCLEMRGMNAALALIIGKLYTPVAAIGARWVRWPTSEFEKCEAKGSVKCENWIRSSSHPHKKEEFRCFVQKL